MAVVLPGFGVLLAAGLAPELPSDGVDRARETLRRAEREAAELAPDALVAARLSAQSLEVTFARARSAWVPTLHRDEVEALALETEALALRAVQLARVRSQRRVESLAVDVERLREELDALRPHLAVFPADRELRAAVRRAELDLDAAARDLPSDAPGRAFAAVERASEALGRAEERLDHRTARLSDPAWLRRWQAWADETVAATRRGRSAVVVEKARGVTHLVSRGRVVVSFPSEVGRAGLSPKRHAGDAATPEGRYRVAELRDRGRTKYYRALLLDYPNAEDRARFAEGRRRGEIAPGRAIGGLIEIHGHGGKGTNWTDGCVALADPDMDRLFEAVEPGTPVTIVGQARLPGLASEEDRRE